MTDSRQIKNVADFLPFEGMWLLTKPSGAVACAKVVDERLLIPFSFAGKEKLGGHFYNCRIVASSLVCRFEHFDSAISGFLLLSVGPNDTLTGARWKGDQISETEENIFLKTLESRPGKEEVVWVRIPNAKPPSWAEKYFSEDWPNKNQA